MKEPPKKTVADADGDTVPGAKLRKAKAGGPDPASSEIPSNLLGSGSGSGTASNDGGTRGMMLGGSHPVAATMNAMATIEQSIRAIAQQFPAILPIADPALSQMKAIIASGLADLSSGGLGMPNVSAPGGMGGAPGMMPMPGAAPAPAPGMPMAPPPPLPLM